MQVHLYDFRWNSPEEVEFQASNGSRFGRKPLKKGDPLSVQVVGEVACAGSMREGDWQPCAQHITGRKKCETCRNREGNFVVTSFDGFNTDIFSAEDLSKLDGEHVVYLALFEKNLKKVGVSKLSRKTLRQVEQGAQQTLFIAQTPNGILARQIETCLRQTGLKDKIQASAKKDSICPDITLAEGEAELRSALEAAKPGLANHDQIAKMLLDEPEFYDWTDTYGLDALNHSSKPLHTVKLDQNESVSGTIAAIKGPFVVLETEDEMVCLCAKDLQGLKLDFTPKPVGLNLNSALQNALF